MSYVIINNIGDQVSELYSNEHYAKFVAALMNKTVKENENYVHVEETAALKPKGVKDERNIFRV